MEVLLELQDISKSYSGVEVLRGVNAKLSAGEVLCLVGENGAGKSTLIKIISGVVQPDKGSIRYFGKEHGKLQPRQIIDMGIATIYQDIDLVDNLTVADNVFLGKEIRNRWGFIDSLEQEKQTDALLDQLNITTIRGAMPLTDLATSQKQCVQIVKALNNKARVLILDEPTASLGDKETKVLVDLVKSLSAQGLGIIYISHYIEELMELGDTMLILKDGTQVALHKKVDVTPDRIIHDMIGRDASSFYVREHFKKGDRTLQVQHYQNQHTVHDVSFEMKSGEVLGFGGLVGAGRTELIRMIYGADPKLSGQVFLNGDEITPVSPKDAIQKGIFMISEDRKGEGLLNLRSVKENIMITHNEKKEWIDLKQEIQMVDQMIEELEIKTPGQNASVTSLSGGNQQKAIIARCVLDPGEIYIFDEPTKGVDVGAKEEIYKHILNLAKKDKFVILVSSEMPELLSMSDRIAIMCEGKLVDIVETKDASEDYLMKKYLGIE